VATAVASAVKAIDPTLAILAISGTQLEQAARAQGMQAFAEVFADRAYLSSGQLMPRSRAGAVLHDPREAADRLLGYLRSGKMPVDGAEPIALKADSICVHGDNREAVEMARHVRARLAAEGIVVTSFVG